MAEGNAINIPFPDPFLGLLLGQFSAAVGGEMGVHTGRREGTREGIWEVFNSDCLLSAKCIQLQVKQMGVIQIF